MNKTIRVILVFAGLGLIVAAASSRTVWANKLITSAAGSAEQGAPSANRPQGTVATTDEMVNLTPGVQTTVGSCATVTVQRPPAGIEYTASVTAGDAMAGDLPGKLTSCGIKIEATLGSKLAAEAEICFPIPPSSAGLAYYWDGVQWVKTSLEAKDSQSCVIVPPNAGNPAFSGFFDQ